MLLCGKRIFCVCVCVCVHVCVCVSPGWMLNPVLLACMHLCACVCACTCLRVCITWVDVEPRLVGVHAVDKLPGARGVGRITPGPLPRPQLAPVDVNHACVCVCHVCMCVCVHVCV
jgi:hypothetical protein